MKLSREQLIAAYPHASESFLRANSVGDGIQPNVEARATRPSATDKKCPEGKPLECPTSREDPRWYGDCTRFGIRFVIYAVRPADWDGWHVKELQDLLIEAGLIPDDSWKVIEEGTVTTRKVHKAEDQRTEITITSL